jgi:optic atrophy protein 1
LIDSLLFRLARRLEREVKEILDDFSSDETLKSNLLKGKRVELAEELSKIFLFINLLFSSSL